MRKGIYDVFVLSLGTHRLWHMYGGQRTTLSWVLWIKLQVTGLVWQMPLPAEPLAVPFTFQPSRLPCAKPVSCSDFTEPAVIWANSILRKCSLVISLYDLMPHLSPSGPSQFHPPPGGPSASALCSVSSFTFTFKALHCRSNSYTIGWNVIYHPFSIIPLKRSIFLIYPSGLLINGL